MPRTLWALASHVCDVIGKVSQHISPFDGEITDKQLKATATATAESEGHDPGNRGGALLIILLWRFRTFRRLIAEVRHEDVSILLTQCTTSSYDAIESGEGIGNRCTNLLESLILHLDGPSEHHRRIHLFLLRIWEITGRVALMNKKYEPGLNCGTILGQIQSQDIEDRLISDVWFLFYVHLYGYKILDLQLRYPKDFGDLRAAPESDSLYKRGGVTNISSKVYPEFGTHGSKCWPRFLWFNMKLFNALGIKDITESGTEMLAIDPERFIEVIQRIGTESWANDKIRTAVTYITRLLQEFEQQREDLGAPEGFWLQRIDVSAASSTQTVRLLPRHQSFRRESSRDMSPRDRSPRRESHRHESPRPPRRASSRYKSPRRESSMALDEIVARLHELNAADLVHLQERLTQYLAWNSQMPWQ